MEYSKQSLYKFINDNKILKIEPLRTENDAEIIKITKMKDQESIDDSFENKNKKIYIDKLPDGIYKVDILQEIKNDAAKKRNYYLTVEKKKLLRQTSKYPTILSGPVKPFEDKIYRNNKIRISESDWLKLLNFFMVQNPSLKNGEPSTAQYYEIKKYWGNNCWQRGNTLKKKLIDTIPNYQHIVRSVETSEDMKRPLKELKLDKLEEDSMETKICIVDTCSNIFLSVFRHIRNGLAHGRFRFYQFEGGYFLFLEDIYKKHVTARMILDVSILLKWINIIKKGDIKKIGPINYSKTSP